FLSCLSTQYRTYMRLGYADNTVITTPFFSIIHLSLLIIQSLDNPQFSHFSIAQRILFYHIQHHVDVSYISIQTVQMIPNSTAKSFFIGLPFFGLSQIFLPSYFSIGTGLYFYAVT